MKAERKKKGIKVSGKGVFCKHGWHEQKRTRKSNEGASAKERIGSTWSEWLYSLRLKECAWVEPIQYDVVKERRKTLDLERARIRNNDKAQKMIQSTVVRSVVNGGIPDMTREDAEHEIQWELEYTFK